MSSTLQASRKRQKNDRRLFRDAWEDLANIEIDVEAETESHAPKESQVITPSSQALTEFHLFPQLPLQLRRMIWGFAISPRAIQEGSCKLLGRDSYDGFSPSIPRPLYPLNIAPYHNMPAAFWACSESRNEIAWYYKNIAFISENINLYPRYLPASFFEKSKPSSASNYYSIEQATLSFKKLLAESPSRPLEPSIPFNPDQDMFDFDRLETVSANQLYQQERDLFLHNTPIPSGTPPWRGSVDRHFGSMLIHPWDIKKVRITPESICWQQFARTFDKYDISRMEPRIFANFIFQDLDELVFRDDDCMLEHMFNWEASRAGWKEYLLKMFKVESAHNEFASVRAGSTFKVPKIVFWLGQDNGIVCDRCLKEQRESRRMRQFVKRVKYQDKQFRIEAGCKF
ncbi:hypothetical protein EAE96_008715 [Botrytis aclada]|nr:hypothetical protein EAE96_008715 [Botrytis aclada]